MASTVKKKLQDQGVITVKEVMNALQRNDAAELRLVAITLALSDLDFHFIQSVCIRLCSSENDKVRGNALISLGHLARRYRLLDEQTVKPIVEKGLLDASDYVRECAKSAADEIHQFLHWTIQGHVYG